MILFLYTWIGVIYMSVDHDPETQKGLTFYTKILVFRYIELK